MSINPNIWNFDPVGKFGGMKAGEVFTMTSSRGTGKSAFSSAQFQKLWKDIFDKSPKPITDLILDEGTVFGAKYHTVEPVGGHWPDMEDWARQTFGDPADIWERDKFMWPECGRWYMNDRKFWFRNLKDRDWFVVRWRS